MEAINSVGRLAVGHIVRQPGGQADTVSRAIEHNDGGHGTGCPRIASARHHVGGDPDGGVTQRQACLAFAAAW